jgi:hypothetical protein
MKALYNEYLTGEDRALAIIEANANAQFAKLDVLYEAVNAKLNADLLAAEAKVLTESGTYDDLELLYTEAEKEADKAKESLLQKIINGIINFFNSIGEFISGLFTKKLENVPQDATIQVEENTEAKVNFMQKVWDTLAKPFNVLKSGSAGNYTKEDIAKAWAGITAEATTLGFIAAATGTAVSATVKAHKNTNGEGTSEGDTKPVTKETILSLSNNLMNIKDLVIKACKALGITIKGATVANAVVNATTDTQNNTNGTAPAEQKENKFIEICKTALGYLKKFGGWIKKLISELMASLSSVGTKKATENKLTENKEETSTQTQTTETENTHTETCEDDSDYVIFESESVEREYNELVEAFAEL